MKGKIKEFSVFLILVVLISFFIGRNSFAASLNTLSDKMSRHAPGIAADHEIKFTTPSGISSSGQYLRLTFDSGFNLSAIGAGDLDLLHGQISGLETNQVLAGSPSATAWGVSISGSHIDLIHPSSSSGSIAPNDKVVIRIGTNAGGIHQITNPTIIGSKTIAISGNYGDSGKLAVPIAEDQIGVGGQTSGAPPNPVVLTEEDYTATLSVDLDWTQNVDFDFDHYAVFYSTSPNLTNLTGILVDSIFVRTQTSYTISGLAVNQDYYYKVYVYDTEGLFAPSNEVHSRISSGGGPIIPPQPPPVITFEKIGAVTCEEGRCAYFTDRTYLSGGKPENVILFFNNSINGLEYPSPTTWRYFTLLNMGENIFEIYGQDNYGQTSNTLALDIKRFKVGDSNGDGKVDDFDLSTLAAHWETSWCFTDFNMDNFVDDFDISALAAHWDAVF